MFEGLPLSEGARRVLAAVVEKQRKCAGARTLTQLLNAPSVVGRQAPEAVSLLVCLWEDGSRGAELLVGQGVDEALMEALTSGSPQDEDQADSTPSPADKSSAADQEAPSSWLSELVRESHRLAGNKPGPTEIGTEHLLAALLNFLPLLCENLSLSVSNGDELLQQALAGDEASTEPIEVTVRLRSLTPSVDEQANVCRTLDAAANRCREGLRVLEDYVRFQMEDPFLSRLLKQLRHDLQTGLNQLGEENWVRFRDAQTDVGPVVSRELQAPQFRGSVADVLRANCKRVEEALRTLEEFGKLRDHSVAGQIERLRYSFYTVEKGLMSLTMNRYRLAEARLYLLVTDRLCPCGAGPLVREVLGAGVDVVQLREKEMPDRRLINLARQMREWTEEAGVLLIINDRPDVAAIVGADGVHLGQDDASVAEARRIVGSQALIGVSTHHIEQARQAILDGADYLGAGPVFPSQTKSFDNFPGLEYVREIAGETTLPWYPLGGIDLTNIDQVLAAGATRVAVSSVICQAAEPAGTSDQIACRLREPI